MIYHCAGVLGVDPSPFTLGELLFMAEARDRTIWNHTAALMMTLANIHRDPRQRRKPYAMEEFHPYMQGEKKVPEVKGQFAWLESIFCKREMPREMMEAMIDAGHNVFAS